MSDKPSVYLAFASTDRTFADVLRVHCEHRGMRCFTREDRDQWATPSIAIHTLMNACDLLIVIDSELFRALPHNYELQHAQTLQKPLIVVSLDRPVDERHSNHRLQLFDFTKSHDWQRLLQIIWVLFD